MSTKSAVQRSSPAKRSNNRQRPQPIQRRALGGGSPNPAEMQKRLGNQGTQAWLAGQRIQPKLTIGQPGDQYEQEADRTAETVMRMPDPGPSRDEETKDQTKPQLSVLQRSSLSTSTKNHPIQRLCTECEKELGGQSEQNLQRKENNEQTPHVTQDVEARINALDGKGSPLPDASRNFFEPRFGADFSQVRVHTGTQAAETAKSINAKAFTIGNNIVFGSGQFSPNSHEGQKLMGHELTHVVQQTGKGTNWITESQRISKAEKLVQCYSWDDFTDDLESAGEAAVEGVEEVRSGVVSGAEAVGEAVVSGSEAVGDVVAGGAAAVDQTVSDAVSWIETEAGKLALAGAYDLARLSGGTVRIVGTGIVITIPDMQFCTPRSIPVMTMPMMNALIPIWGWAGMFGPVGVGAAAGFRVGIQPSIAVSYGPCRLRDMSLVLDPLAGTYAGTAQLYIAGAVTETAPIEAVLKAIGVIGLFDPPIALMADIEGGLRGTLRGSGVGALQETVSVAYAGGAFSLDLMNTLKLGATFELDLDFLANASLYDFVVCEYVLPLASWTLASNAERYDLPVSVISGGVSVGPVTSKPIPFTDIEVFINRTRPQTRCLSLKEIKHELCRRGYLPPPLCTTTAPPSATGPAISPPGEGGNVAQNAGPCSEALPIRWPRELPLPSSKGDLLRIGSDDDSDGTDRGPEQRKFQKEIAKAREKGLPPPNPCFGNDAEPNAPYDAHHSQPIFLNGVDRRENLCSLETGRHQTGHRRLNNQKDQAEHDPTWINCGVTQGSLPLHPPGQKYDIDGRK